MTKKPRKSQKQGSPERPRTRLRVDELLESRSKPELATAMGLKYYNQIYEICGSDANPTLLMLEKLARGLSKLRSERVRIAELLDESTNQ